MDFKQIEAFIYVARLKSFSKAAEAIFLSQPTISSHIGSLENELGTTLFDRLGKEVQLTPAGAIFYEYAVNMIAARDNAKEALQEYFHKISGKLNLASSTTPCKCMLPPIIQNFLKLYPDVSFKIYETSSGEVLNRVISFEAEIGIIGRNTHDDRLICTELAEDNLVAITPAVQRFKRIDGNFVNFKDIQFENFILREQSSATRQIFESSLKSIGYNIENLNIISEVSSMDAALQLVKYGLGITVISENAASEYITSGLVKRFYIKDLHLKRKIYMVRHGRKTLSPTARAFERFILSVKQNPKSVLDTSQI